MKGTGDEGSKGHEHVDMDQETFNELRRKLSEDFRNVPIEKSERTLPPNMIIPNNQAQEISSHVDSSTSLVPRSEEKNLDAIPKELSSTPAKNRDPQQIAAASGTDKAVEPSGAVMFAEGLFHGAIENPYNGAVQFINHMGGSLPELHLVDETAINNSTMGNLGNMLGATVDFFALAAATGGFGSALRMGAVAAGYAGILQPSDANSTTFAEDRLKQAGVAGLSGLGMGLAAWQLPSFGVQAVSGTRSFGQSLFYGGLAGGLGGLIHSEADAIINKQRLLPTYQDFGTDLFGGVAFGAALGGLGHIANGLKANLKTIGTADSRLQANLKTIDTGDSRLQFRLGDDGQPVQVFLKSNTERAYYNTAKISARKLADGSWESKGYTTEGGIIAQPKPEAAILNASVNPNGGVTLTLDKLIQDGISPISAGQVNRTFLPGQSDSKFWTDLSARDPGQRFAAWARPLTAIALFRAAGL